MDNWGYHGQHMIRIAEKEGFIEREVGVKPGPDKLIRCIISSHQRARSSWHIYIAMMIDR